MRAAHLDTGNLHWWLGSGQMLSGDAPWQRVGPEKNGCPKRFGVSMCLKYLEVFYCLTWGTVSFCCGTKKAEMYS